MHRGVLDFSLDFSGLSIVGTSGRQMSKKRVNPEAERSTGAMADGVRRIDATTAKYSDFVDVMKKNQPVECLQQLRVLFSKPGDIKIAVNILSTKRTMYLLSSAVALTCKAHFLDGPHLCGFSCDRTETVPTEPYMCAFCLLFFSCCAF